MQLPKGFFAATRPDGSQIAIAASAVTAVVYGTDLKYAPSVKTLINIGGTTQGVSDTVEDVLAAISAAQAAA